MSTPLQTQNTTQPENFWKKQIYNKHLVITAIDEQTDLTNISPFKLAKELKKLGNIQNIKKKQQQNNIDRNW